MLCKISRFFVLYLAYAVYALIGCQTEHLESNVEDRSTGPVAYEFGVPYWTVGCSYTPCRISLEQAYMQAYTYSDSLIQTERETPCCVTEAWQIVPLNSCIDIKLSMRVNYTVFSVGGSPLGVTIMQFCCIGLNLNCALAT
jgi:hypothetical protein